MKSVTSNTRDCFRAFVGQKVIGLLFDALPIGRRDISSGTKTIVFEDGRGLTICGNGSFWVDSVDDVQRAVDIRKQELNNIKSDIKEVLVLAGAMK